MSLLLVLVFTGVFLLNSFLTHFLLLRKARYTLKAKFLFYGINLMFCLFGFGSFTKWWWLSLVAVAFYLAFFIFKDRLLTGLKE